MTATTTPIFELNNGVQIPALGLGVFQTPPDETRDAVRAALASQRPDSLWVRAALTEAGDDPGRR